MIKNLLNGFGRAALTVCVAAACAIPAQAALTELGELQNGVTYEFPGDFGSVSATFTVLQDGNVRVECTGTEIPAYKDADYDGAFESDFSYINGNPVRIYKNLHAGDVMYFYCGFVMDKGTITVNNGEIPLKVVSMDPSPNEGEAGYYGGSFSISGDSRVQFNFNLPVKVSAGTLQVGDTKINVMPEVSMNMATMTVAPTMLNMYRNGTLKAGDEMTLTLSGVTEKDNPNNKANGTGVVEAKFIVAGMPITLVSTQNTPTTGEPVMLSYYLPDNPAAKVKFTFSGNLNTENPPFARITYGNMDYIEAEMYNENLQGTIDGNTITFDLAGVVRRPEVMCPDLPADKRVDYIAFVVHNIKGEDGQYMYTGSVSNPYTLPYSYTLGVVTYTIASDYTPNPAIKDLAAGDAMEIFVMDGKNIEFDGVKFTYTASGAEAEYVVPMSMLTVAPDELVPSDILINLTAPELPGIDADSQVVVTLNNLLCADGLDHQQDVTATYKQYAAGVNSVAAQQNEADVYNAQGIRVLKAASAAQVNNLPAGLYIFGSQKVIVK